MCFGNREQGGGALFSESFWDGVYSIIQILNNGKGLKHTCLERGPCLSGKGLLSWEYNK